MYAFLKKHLRLARTTAWLLVVCLTASLAAPALHAEKQELPGYEETVTATQTSVDQAAASQDGDVLFSRAPRTDRNTLARTISVIVGAGALGLLGFSFGWVGLFVGAAIGGGLGYLISRELFQDYRPRWDGSYNSDPYYDSYYGYGSQFTPIPDFQRGSEDAGTAGDLGSLQQAYFQAMDDYRAAIRDGDMSLINSARQDYMDAYQAMNRARVAGYR